MNLATDVQPQRRHYSVDDLLRMVAAGIVLEDERVELIEGELIDMPPIGAPHSGLVNRLNRLLVMAAGTRAVVSVQNGLRLGEFNLPQPDFVVLRKHPHDYMVHLPTPGDVLLVIEVSHTTLTYDTRIKMPLYAAHGIAEAWIVDATSTRVLRYSEPSDGQYRRVETIDGLVTLSAMSECAVDLAGLFETG